MEHGPLLRHILYKDDTAMVAIELEGEILTLIALTEDCKPERYRIYRLDD